MAKISELSAGALPRCILQFVRWISVEVNKRSPRAGPNGAARKCGSNAAGLSRLSRGRLLALRPVGPAAPGT
ncbi:hypothetical protein ABBQ38_006527 [Trebouxia sp. C0009 RCD-2024]